MVITQKLVQEINSIVADEPLVLCVDEAVPALLGEAAENVVILSIELNVVLVKVVEKVLSAENLCNLDQLIRIAVSVEEGFLAEDHGGKHGAKRPHVERVVVLLEVDEQFGALEVARRNAHIILCASVVELSKAPINEPQLALLVVDHYVVGFDIAVHNTLAVTKIKRLAMLALMSWRNVHRRIPSKAQKYRIGRRNPGTWGIGF